MIPGKIKPQPDLFGEPPVSVADRLEMAYQEHKNRKIAGVSVIEGVWEDRPEMIQKFGVIVWFPARKNWKCCQQIDDREASLKADPRKWEKHVMTYKHIANLFDVSALDLERYCVKRDKDSQDGRDAYIFGAIQGGR